ncbi:lysine-specific demethylase lid [Adelges cooleyi]|uniref:lysine-specific demethylase lid n=1 Tax=Adelges cooleyi TaxID=133065 RepID=UPI00217FD071|nr:lysine-specific demethylase lid [Adelges cooleyi]
MSGKKDLHDIKCKLEIDEPKQKQCPEGKFIDPASMMEKGKFVFKVPPEAPVFEPTVEEFKDPLKYIAKIRSVAQAHGICKIRPPPDWHPPFCVDVDKFKFTPRIQKLNELDASTRVKLNFLEKIAKYWHLQGVRMKIPVLEQRAVDLYSLYKIVEFEGSYDKVCSEKKWTKVASRMGYVCEKQSGTVLKNHYEKWLHPFALFHTTIKDEIYYKPVKRECEIENEKEESSSASSSPSKRARLSPDDEKDSDDYIKDPFYLMENKELRKLQFFGAGPKMAGFSSKCRIGHLKSKESKKSKRNRKAVVDELAKYYCQKCGSGKSEETILICDGCDLSFHMQCLMPPLTSVPKGEWRCPKCVANEVIKPSDAFGFEQAQREYTLQQFGEMADQFKSKFFNMPVHLVPTEKVEQEYWKIVSSIDSTVIAEYGADLHTMDHGSGFPTSLALRGNENNTYYKSYIEDSWNLNNIPVLKDSVLSFINADISGMKVPWMYVGMCFSTFCWHNEDHWSYSINYLHWGEPKTWYGVPGDAAEAFEEVMKETTPELFHSQPDLLHQLVTILNPNILMKEKVPIYRTDQEAGEFVVTFPRSYHTGFNQGYNFAEAVNFAPADWISMGRECVNHYSSLKRICVFSHDELICNMVSTCEDLAPKSAELVYDDLAKMVKFERIQRKALLDWGVTEADFVEFEQKVDDLRQCIVCNTTLYISAVSCSCDPNKLACLRHFKQLCGCPASSHTFKYRYTLDEFPPLLRKVKAQAEMAYDE